MRRQCFACTLDPIITAWMCGHGEASGNGAGLVVAGGDGGSGVGECVASFGRTRVHVYFLTMGMYPSVFVLFD